MAAVDTIPPIHLPVSFSSTPYSCPNPAQNTSNGAAAEDDTGKVEQAPKPVVFDPEKHLVFTSPSKVHTMKELGYRDDVGVSPIGVSEPFPLFSDEAIKQMRSEVLSEEVWNRYRYSSNLAQCQLRGFAPE